MAELLKTLGEVVTAMITHVGTVATTITSTPYLLVTSGIMLCGAAVGLLGRMIHRS